LKRFFDQHGDLPRDVDGVFTLDVLSESQESEGRNTKIGVDDLNHYVVAPNVTAADLEVGKGPYVIVLDAPANHILYGPNGLKRRRNLRVQEQAFLLLSDWTIVYWTGDSEAYLQWTRRLVTEAVPTGPPKGSTVSGAKL
jgi:hypothetical protein